MTRDPTLPPEQVLMRLEHLVDEITTHPGTRTTRRTAGVVVGTAATVLVAVSVGAVTVAGSPALGTPAFAVTTERDDVVIRIVDTTADAEQMTAQLAARGLDVQVLTAPANPQVVGTWVGVSAEDDTDEAVYDDVVEQALGYPEDVVVPADVTGLTLIVGVAPQPGEDLAVIGLRNAFAPGQPLECSPARGATVAEATVLLTDQGWEVQTVAVGSLRPVTVGPAEIVTIAFRLDESTDDLMLVTVDPDDPRLSGQLGWGFSPRALAHGEACG